MEGDLARKEEILTRLVDYVFEHGLSDLSLRPVAAQVGTSARMLIYHFGTKDQLMIEVLEAAGRRQWQKTVLEAGRGDPPPPELARRMWAGLADDSLRSYLRLFYEVYGMALQHREPFDRLLETVVAEPLAFIRRSFRQAGLERPEAQVEATLALATMRGLLLDLLVTGERERCDAALETYVADLARRLPVAPTPAN